ELLQELRGVHGVQAAQPLIIERVLLPEFGNRTAILIGLDASAGSVADKNPFNASVTVTNPAAWLSGRGVVVGSDLAGVLAAGGRPAQPLKIRAAGREQEVIPGGVVDLHGKAAKLGGFLLVMDVRQAAKLLNQDGICERIDIYLEPGADREQVKQFA